MRYGAELMNFPPPDATYWEVQAWYDAHGVIPEKPTPKVKPDTFISFCGQDGCSDECEGWDGESRRCQCGNRRVYWDHHDDGTAFANAD